MGSSSSVKPLNILIAHCTLLHRVLRMVILVESPQNGDFTRITILGDFTQNGVLGDLTGIPHFGTSGQGVYTGARMYCEMGLFYRTIGVHLRRMTHPRRCAFW